MYHHPLVGVRTRRPALAATRAFRSDAAAEAISSFIDRGRREIFGVGGGVGGGGGLNVALYNYPSFAGAYAALFASLFHSKLHLPFLPLPFSSFHPFRVEDLSFPDIKTCYLLDFIGPEDFSLQLSQFIPRVIAFDHRQSTVTRISKMREKLPSNLDLRVDTHRSSARSAFDFFSAELLGDGRSCGLLNKDEIERVTHLIKYLEDCDLCQWKLPDIKFFSAGIKDLRAKLNCIVNPHLFDQAVRSDGNSDLSHEIGLELSRRSAAIGLRPIGAAVFMQRGILKVCLRSFDSTTDTSEIAKAYGGGGKSSSSSFTLRMDEYNLWTSVNAPGTCDS